MTDGLLPVASYADAPPPPPVGAPSQTQPPPRGKAPFRWLGYPGVSLLGVRRSVPSTIGIAALAILLLFAALAGVGLWSRSAEPSADVWALAFLAAYLAGYGSWFLLLRLGVRASVPFRERVGLRPFDIAPGLIAAFVAMSAGLWFEILFMGMLVLIGIEVPRAPSVADIFPVTPVGIAVAIVVTCIAAPLAEEVLYRGVLFGGLRDRFGDWIAALVSSVAFAASHLNWYLLIPFTVLGMLFAWITSQTRSVWPSVIAHAVFNLNAVILGYLYYLLYADVQPAWVCGLREAIVVLAR